MGKTGLVGEVTLQYLERFPKLGALTLAKKMYAENVALFTSVEHARGSIRRYLGQTGNYHRGVLKNTKFVRDSRLGLRNLPASEATPWEPVYIPEIYNKGLAFSDMHYPYQDNRAVNAMIDHAVGRGGINFILINGDGLDMYQGSKFNRDPRKRSISDEIWGWIEFLNILKDEFPKAQIYWKLGNHCERLEHYLMTKAPELLDFEEFKLGEILKIRGMQGIEVISRQLIYTGRLAWLHGHELPGGAASPVSPARGLALKTLTSSVVSHHHKTSAQTETDLNGKLMSWYSIGCMCDLHPEYMLINKWNAGFAYIETEGKEFEFHNMKVYQGKVYSD